MTSQNFTKLYSLLAFKGIAKPTRTAFAFVAISCMTFSCKKNDDPIATQTTGVKTTFALISSAENTLAGAATIEENQDHSFNVKIDLTKTAKDSTIYIDIHNGSFRDPFERQAIFLGSIKCTGGTASNITSNIKWAVLDNTTRIPMTYDSIITFKGFINLSYSETVHKVSTAIAHVIIK